MSLADPGEPRVPLLEFDPDPTDPISEAALRARRLDLPTRAVLTFLGPATAAWAKDHGFAQVGSVRTITAAVPLWAGRHEEVDIALVEAPFGAPAAVIILEKLIQYGVRTVVAVGSCGGLVPLDEGTFVLPTRALRDEGTSYHYAPPARWVDTDEPVRRALADAVRRAGFTPLEAPTWTTDAFFRETRGRLAARRAEGCAVVDMECAALAACARLRGVAFAQLLFTADTLADDEHDVRGWGRASHTTALRIALSGVSGVARSVSRREIRTVKSPFG